MSRQHPNLKEASDEIIDIIGLNLGEDTRKKIEQVIEKYANQLSSYNEWSNSVSWEFGPGS